MTPEDHLNTVRSQPCCICGARPPSDPHHTRSRGAGGLDGGAIPLCRAHHTEIGTLGIGWFERKHHTSIPIEVAKMLHLVLFGCQPKWPEHTMRQLYETEN